MSNHLMIDLETLNSSPTSAVLSIGVAVFDPAQNKIMETFEWFIAEISGSVSMDTLRWWFSQKPEAILKLLSGLKGVSAVPIEAALRELQLFAAGHKCKEIWSHGGSFDLPIIRYHADRHHIMMPWKYWDERCTRTLYALKGKPTITREGTHHSAMDDAIYQAKCVMEVINR